MIISQLNYTDNGDWLKCSRAAHCAHADLALVFWSEQSPETVLQAAAALRSICPDAIIAGCSTSGVIQDRLLLDATISATLISFKHTTLRAVTASLHDTADSTQLGRNLGRSLHGEDLTHVFVLGEGLAVNGCSLAEGLTATLPSNVAITGGLAGDGERFERTQVLYQDTLLERGAVAIGFYGNHLQIGIGCRGGWLPFGPERLITASAGNVLMELDGGSALALYEHYLGKHAANLPASGHLFPMYLQKPGKNSWVVRTILGVDRDRQALIFGGDVPQGSLVQLMRGRPDNLLDGAEEAGRDARIPGSPRLAILVSCVGRRMLLGQLAEEEIESVADAAAPEIALTGFYSYGEIAPDAENACSLHNQTMTVTVLGELD